MLVAELLGQDLESLRRAGDRDILLRSVLVDQLHVAAAGKDLHVVHVVGV